MKNLSRVLLILVLCLAATATARAEDTAPDALVKSTTDEVLKVIRETNDAHRLNEVARGKVVPHFDFVRMTRLAVGKDWKKATPEQQQALEKEFRDLLVRTYTSALSSGRNKDAQINVSPLGGAQGNGQEVTVHTHVSGATRKMVPIDYDMEHTPEGWKVYDVVVDSVSLVTNYRTTFAQQVTQGGIDGLVKFLAQKNAGAGSVKD